MEPVCILFLIFGICLLLASGWIYLLKDPRDSIFFVRAHSLRKKNQRDAIVEARKTAKYIAIVGIFIIVLSLLGILISTLSLKALLREEGFFTKQYFNFPS